MVIGTLYDVYDYIPTSGISKFLLAFSVYTNGQKLLSVEKKSGQLDCIHGIRFVSMTWVMLGHTYYFAANYIDNLGYFYNILKEFTSQAILNATVSVDSFFVMSGLLLTYLWLTQTNKLNGNNVTSWYHWLMFYVHRYIRLTPVYMLIIGMDIALFRYLTDGPLWKQEGVEIDRCDRSWYWNMLYLNNFLGTDQLVSDELYRIGLFAPIGFAMCIGLVGMTGGLLGYVNWLWDFPPNGVWTLAPEQFNTNPLTGLWYFKYAYIRTYTRCGTYVIGMMFGYALYRIQKKNGTLKWKIHWALNLFVWWLAAAVAMCVLYGLLPISRGDVVPKSFDVFYSAVNRNAWGLVVGWVIFACVTGNGGYVNTMLSWNLIMPLSRLTYCAYLVHPLIMYLVYEGRDRAVHYDSHFTMVYFFLSHFLISYAAAFVLSLAFESPILTLEKLLLPRDSSSEPTSKSSKEGGRQQVIVETNTDGYGKLKEEEEVDTKSSVHNSFGGPAPLVDGRRNPHPSTVITELTADSLPSKAYVNGSYRYSHNPVSSNMAQDYRPSSPASSQQPTISSPSQQNEQPFEISRL